MSIERCKARGTGNIFYKLYCSDDYNHGGWLAGSPLKVVSVSEKTLGKALNDDIVTNAPFNVGNYVYVLYNEYGYCNYVRFYSEADRQNRQQGNNTNAASVPPTEAPPVDDDYPFT